MWEYILASERQNRRLDADRQFFIDSAHYSIPELVEQYNVVNKTKFVGTNDGWLRHSEYGNCHIKTLDGMCGVLIAHKLGIATQYVPHFYPLIEWLAKKGNYTYITMSNISGERIKAWKNVGFKTMLDFRNRRTGNDVELLIKKVPYEAT